jgi:hypothetical protein
MLVERKLKDSNISVVQFKDYYSIPLDELKEIFSEYQQKQIIQATSFEEDIWYLYNEKLRRRIVFQLDEIKYNKAKRNRTIFPYVDIVNALKGYVLYKLNVHPIESISEDIRFLKGVIEETDFFHLDMKKVLVSKKLKKDGHYFKHTHTLIEFLEYFPIAESDEFLNLLYYQAEVYSKSREKNQGLNRREIGIFESVFELGDALDTYWEHCSEDEKEEFYPIKLWWEITTTIPIRVSEFILTPYDCLSEEDGFYYLSVRRTKLKGNGVNVKHKVEEDYTLQKIRISEGLYRLIEKYRDLVDDYDFVPNFFYEGYQHTGRRKYLLSQRAYFKHLRFKGATGASGILEFFSVSNLNYLLKQFYTRVIVGIFNYELVSKGDQDRDLLPYQLEYVNLMDTRHFAFINMVLNDLEPMIIKEISGHSSIKSSYHYYSHVDKFVKCFTYNMAKKISRKKQAEKGEFVIGLRKSNQWDLAFRKVFDPNYEEELNQYKDVKGGKCSSKQKEYEDCRKVDNHCQNCEFFHPTDTEAQKNIKDLVLENQRRISTEALALKELVKQYDKVQSFAEDYGLRINKIKTIANQNALMLSKYFL